MSATRAARDARAVRALAQAKVNLRLRILARETSGFHQLETIFLRLALADVVDVCITNGARTLDVEGEIDARQLGPTEQNLAWRAAEAYAAATGWPAGFAIRLEKHIPVGGGLGGGSADAGAVLRALDVMSPSPVGPSALLAIAAQLGSDVPFLTSECVLALGWGRGERLLSLPAPPEREVLLLLPPFGVATAQAYGWLAAARESGAASGDAAVLLDAGSLSSWERLAGYAVNDFEPVVAARRPQVTALAVALHSAGCIISMMSGSGSSVFGILPVSGAVDLPRFAPDGDPAAPRAVLTRTASRVEPVSILD